MAEILVRGLDEAVVARLKKLARKEGRSLQSAVRSILEQAARTDAESALRLADRIRSRFRGREFDDSAELIREDREVALLGQSERFMSFLHDRSKEEGGTPLARIRKKN